MLLLSAGFFFLKHSFKNIFQEHHSGNYLDLDQDRRSVGSVGSGLGQNW